MNRYRVALLLSLFALPLSAGNIWFDPPNPTSRTPITAHVQASISCLPNGAEASVNGHLISIGLKQTQPCTVPPPADGYLFTVDLGVLPAGVYDVIAGYAPPGILIGLGEATLPVSDANPPFTVSPNVAMTSGDLVRITGNNLIGCAVGPSPIICDRATVKFGDATAPVVDVAPDIITVQTPVHAPGSVDVSVQTSSGTKTAAAAFNYFSTDKPFDPAFFEPVLFPVMISGDGAFGAKWSTEVWMRNENDYAFPVPGLFNVLCFPICDTRPPAHSTTGTSEANAPNGYLLNVPRQASPNLFFETIVRDLSRQAEAFGTEIPVVREKDFFDRPFTLLDVPTDARYRVALRLYRLDAGTSVHVRIWPMNSQDALVDTFAFLAPAGQGSTYTVGYNGDLLAAYPQLAGNGPLRIELDEGSPQRGTWAFVSVTNNDTHHVSVISPH